jgi:hypothetical protein
VGVRLSLTHNTRVGSLGRGSASKPPVLPSWGTLGRPPWLTLCHPVSPCLIAPFKEGCLPVKVISITFGSPRARDQAGLSSLPAQCLAPVGVSSMLSPSSDLRASHLEFIGLFSLTLGPRRSFQAQGLQVLPSSWVWGESGPLGMQDGQLVLLTRELWRGSGGRSLTDPANLPLGGASGTFWIWSSWLHRQRHKKQECGGNRGPDSGSPPG